MSNNKYMTPRQLRDAKNDSVEHVCMFPLHDSSIDAWPGDTVATYHRRRTYIVGPDGTLTLYTGEAR